MTEPFRAGVFFQVSESKGEPVPGNIETWYASLDFCLQKLGTKISLLYNLNFSWFFFSQNFLLGGLVVQWLNVVRKFLTSVSGITLSLVVLLAFLISLWIWLSPVS